MNLPNILTLSRIPILFVVAVLISLVRYPLAGNINLDRTVATYIPVVALALFIIGALTDWLDGYVARRTNQV